MDYPDLSDEELMARLAYRDIRAFETLYERYGTLVYSTGLRVMGDTQLAEDIAQETFLRLWRASYRRRSATGSAAPEAMTSI